MAYLLSEQYLYLNIYNKLKWLNYITG